MKKKILLFSFLFLSLISCSNTDNENSATIDTTKIISTWNLQSATLNGDEVDSSYKIEFTSNNGTKFYYLNPTSNTTYGPDTIETGTYTIVNNTLTVTWTGSDPGLATAKYDILELTSNKLKIKSVITGEGTLIETYTK